MGRFLIAAALALLAASPALAQDMPLSQILIDGEGWKKVVKPGAKPKLPDVPGGLSYEDVSFTTVSPDGGTMFYSGPDPRFLWAGPMSRSPEEPLFNGSPYAPLRLPRGKEKVKVTGLATDKDGRIYAATELGIQVFDPTGRLCGVLAAPSGMHEWMKFEGNKLTLWVGTTKYERKLRTEGAK